MSFYQFLNTVRGEENAHGSFADCAYVDPLFPKYEISYHELSDYIENYGSIDMLLSVFDELFERYTEWIKF